MERRAAQQDVVSLAVVTSVEHGDPSGQPVATVHVVMTNQNKAVLASGDARIRLPTETLPAPRG
jgi:hypothetical protein